MHLPLFARRAAAGRVLLRCALAGGLLTASACGGDSAPGTGDNTGNASGDEGDETSDGSDDEAVGDAGAGGSKMDAGSKDAGSKDAGGKPGDAGAGGKPAVDAGGIDAGAKSDAGTTDGGGTTSPDTGTATPDSSTPPSSDLCHLEGYDVGILGDSYIQLSGDFTRILQDSARGVKALDANETYVDHSLSGASMNGQPNIPTQYPDAVADSKRRGGKGLKVVIMDGGGNDVLVNNRMCLDPKSVAEVEKNATCVKVVDDTLKTAQKLFDDAVADGVKATIFFFYPHLPKDSLGAGANANNILDYSTPLAKALCDRQTKTPCYFVDMRPAFDDPKNPGWPKPGLIAFDGIHPTLEGSKILAAEVWKVMQDKCIGVK